VEQRLVREPLYERLTVREAIIGAIIDWPESQTGCHLGALVTQINRKLNAPVSQNAVLEAIEALRRRELIESDGAVYRVREPDCRELDLYDLLEPAFLTAQFKASLGIRSERLVFQKTATGGPLGSGLLSKPDFTLAVIQSWRFDPETSLEVYSFEVKNRSGAGLKSVYEAVAHGRLVHHPYLVCPRSRFDPSFNAGMQSACEREGVGLILFDLIADDGVHSINQSELAVRPERRTIDPWIVQQFLEGRLSPENQDRLASHAKGAT
jgi:hypothetical protein